MIAHVAEASEGSGRVLLWLDPGAISIEAATEAAVCVAAAYAAEVETVVIDGPCVGEIGKFGDIPVAYAPFVKGIRHTASRDHLPNARALIADRQRRAVEGIAARRNVVFTHASAGGDAIDALADMCLARGPWNIVAISRPQSSGMHAEIGSILANVSGATGVVVAGRGAVSKSPDVAVVIEDPERAPSMIRAAQRLMKPDGKLHILIAAETASAYGELEGLLRLATADSARCTISPGGPDYGVTGTLDETLVRLKTGFVVARFGGNLLGEALALTRLLAITPAPFLLVR